MDNSSYYCHSCHRTVAPDLPEYTCPICHGGFVERVEGQSLDDGVEDNVGPSVMNALSSFFGSESSPSVSRSGPGVPGPPRYLPDPGSPGEDPADDRGGLRGFSFSASGPGNIHIGVRTSAAAGADTRWLQDLFNIVLGAGWQVDQGGGGGIPILFNFPGGNLGDYAWGQQGLDNVVTQLLNQLEGQGGVPPLTADEIDHLQKTTVTHEMKEKSSQCSVCMDDFQVGDPVRRLVCDHFFHEDCIIPWVERHGTCPVCRKELGSTTRPGGARVVLGSQSPQGTSQSSANPSAAGGGRTGGPQAPSSVSDQADQPSSNAQGRSLRTTITIELGDDTWDQFVEDFVDGPHIEEPDVD